MAKAQEMIAIAMEKGSHFLKWTHKRMDGEKFFADVLLARMEWEGMVVLRRQSAMSRSVRRQKALGESEERLRILFDYAPILTL